MRTRAWRSLIIVSRPVLPNQDLKREGSARASGCQQCGRARWLRYIAWWWRSRERRPTGFGIGFGHCLASFSTSQLATKGNPKVSGSGTDRGETEDRDTGSILVDYQTEEN